MCSRWSSATGSLRLAFATRTRSPWSLSHICHASSRKPNLSSCYETDGQPSTPWYHARYAGFLSLIGADKVPRRLVFPNIHVTRFVFALRRDRPLAPTSLHRWPSPALTWPATGTAWLSGAARWRPCSASARPLASPGVCPSATSSWSSTRRRKWGSCFTSWSCSGTHQCCTTKSWLERLVACLCPSKCVKSVCFVVSLID